MAVVEPYSPCPCGSGQKFKWCCHKVESYADRAQRLLEGGQTEAALKALDDGLKKEPGNAWLLTRKALILTRENRPEEAKETVRTVLRGNTKHPGALVLLTRLALETEGPAEGAAQFQQALSAFSEEERGGLASLAKVVGLFLSEAGYYPAAIRHLLLSLQLEGGPDPEGIVANAYRMILSNPEVSPWFKNLDLLKSAPPGLPDVVLQRFEEAAGWALTGLWASAAAGFETLASDPDAGAAAEANLGLCRLWTADDAGATDAFHRYISRLGPTEEAVDVEVLCQLIQPPDAGPKVELVRLTWPVRDREALLRALRADPAVNDEGPGPLDPDDPDSPEVEEFTLLNRPRVSGAAAEGGKGLSANDVPLILGRVNVSDAQAMLTAFDDGRLDRLSERFTTLAGASLPPAHPKTKVLSRVARSTVALIWEWLLPDDLSPADELRLKREQRARMIGDVWPKTPQYYLGNRTPEQAAKDGDAEVPLRAALIQLEAWSGPGGDGFDAAAMRARLNVPPEPVPDPETVEPRRMQLGRLTLVPIERLSDEKLVDVYRRARSAALLPVQARAATALTERPEALAAVEGGSMPVYTDLATLAAREGDFAAASEWVRRGRQADSPADRAANTPQWDMLDVRLRALVDPPETWVPELAAVLERYRPNAEASQTLVLNLMEMGLIEFVPNPDVPGDMMIDSRVFQALLAQYGPRVTTASGQLGVSAAKPEIWTPGGTGGGSGGIWTPGSAQPSEPGKKLIIR